MTRSETLIELKPIGTIHTPFTEPAGTPIQPGMARGAAGRVVVAAEYAAGLSDLEGFSRIWLIYWLHRAPPAKLMLVPFRDTVERGVFATRAPCRPNPIGISAVRLAAVEGCTLEVLDVDMLDGTPLLDIKPYVPRFDAVESSASGWLDQAGSEREEADDRFSGE